MTYKEFYDWTKQYLGTRLESEKIDITPIVEKLGEVTVEHRINIDGEWYVKENTQEQRPYMLGDTWRTDFDYVGMLEWGLEINEDTHINILEDLLTSFEDVNYHREAEPLHNMIQCKKQLIEFGNRKEFAVLSKMNMENIVRYMREFKNEVRDTINKLV